VNYHVFRISTSDLTYVPAVSCGSLLQHFQWFSVVGQTKLPVASASLDWNGFCFGCNACDKDSRISPNVIIQWIEIGWIVIYLSFFGQILWIFQWISVSQGGHSPGKPGKVGIPKWSGKSQGKWKKLWKSQGNWNLPFGLWMSWRVEVAARTLNWSTVYSSSL